ncbi:MAG TPA: hypothetical protein VFN85_05005 [Solirubrobacterales bacterium]|nr:hypothetical protein [Solirubrobacterales bacterium]
MAPGEEYLELQVIARLKEAFKSREAWEAALPERGPLDDDWVMLQNWFSIVQEMGMMLAHLTVLPDTRAELLSDMDGIVNRSPAWLEAHLEGQQVMTLDLFLHGVAQTLAKQRVAIERVVDEQVDEPASIEEALANAPVPEGTEPRSDLFPAIGEVIAAHTKALVDIAHDLELKARDFFN